MNSKVFLLLVWLAYSPCLPAQTAKKIRVACIGASITYGAGLENPSRDAYPAQLQRLLGEGYQVDNYGVSGATLLGRGDLPYRSTSAFQAALKSGPDIVLIDLGGNDSKLVNRVHLKEFEQDYHALIRSFAQLPSHPRIILLLPIPSFVTDTTHIWDPVIVSGVMPRIRQVAFDEGLEVIDMHSLLVERAAWMPDKIHPDLRGAELMAGRLHELLSQQHDTRFDIFRELPQTRTISSFYGYACASFSIHNNACKIVKPKWTAEGRPWVWRARFWGHEPQADIALLERGFHIVYCDVVELFGNSEAIARWDRFYSLLQKAGLSKKAAMEGMSRGGVYVFNWAAVHPNRVACVYVDNPVLDLKSWPGGLGKVPPEEKELMQLKADYHLTTPEQLRQFSGSPLNKVPQIVQGRYPILILCADEDEAVPPEENTEAFEREVKRLHGDITVIHKPGFKHHPHSLRDPSPIVDFMLKAVRK